MADDSDQEKTEEPSEYKLEESRRKGQVASSKELSSLLVMAASFMALALSLVFIFEQLSEFITWILTLQTDKAFTEKGLQELFAKGALVGVKCIAPIALSAFIIGIFANVMQVGFIYATEALEFKPERINPIEGIKRLFTAKALVEAVKGVFKFVIIISIVYLFMKNRLASSVGFFQLELFQTFLYGKELVIELVFSILAGLSIIAIGDFAWEKYSYKKRHMMTKEEAKKEHKEQDGNPEVKQRIRSIQREMAQKRMMNDVKKADVIVTNPTHISIALKYDGDKMVAPQVLAKGADHLAVKIREIAAELGIPLVENVPLARTLYKTVKVGEGVPRNLYKAVAEVLAFVYKLKKKKKALE